MRKVGAWDVLFILLLCTNLSWGISIPYDLPKITPPDAKVTFHYVGVPRGTYLPSTIKIVRIIDKRLPDIPDKDLKLILEEAKKLTKAKFGIDIVFSDQGNISIQEFFEKAISEERHSRSSEYIQKYNPWNTAAFTNCSVQEIVYRLQLKYYHLKDMNYFFRKGVSSQIKTYEDIATQTLKEYDHIMQELRNSMVNNQPLLDKVNYKYHSASYWVDVGTTKAFEGPYFFITNECVVDDRLLGIHVSTYLGIINGHPPFLSTCPMYIDSDFILQRRGYIPQDIKPKVVGELFTHELGHYLLGFLDRYQISESGCVMQVNKGTLPSLKRYKKITSSKPCEHELKTGQTVVKLRMALKLIKDGDLKASEEIEKHLIKRNRNNINGLYQILAHYVQTKRPLKTKKLISTMLKIAEKPDVYMLEDVAYFCQQAGYQKELRLIKKKIKYLEGKL